MLQRHEYQFTTGTAFAGNVRNAGFTTQRIADPGRTVIAQTTTGPHPRWQLHRRQEVATARMTILAEAGSRDRLLKIQPVPTTGQTLTGGRCQRPVQRRGQRVHRRGCDHILHNLLASEPLVPGSGGSFSHGPGTAADAEKTQPSANSARIAAECSPGSGTAPKGRAPPLKRAGGATNSIAPEGVTTVWRRSCACRCRSASVLSAPKAICASRRRRASWLRSSFENTCSIQLSSASRFAQRAVLSAKRTSLPSHSCSNTCLQKRCHSLSF